jgi:hypothetical protein
MRNDTRINKSTYVGDDQADFTVISQYLPGGPGKPQKSSIILPAFQAKIKTC